MIARCRDLTISIRDRIIVEGLDLDVEEGSSILVTGGCGSGKSLILKAFAGILQLLYPAVRVRGSIEVLGRDPVEALRHGFVKYVPQDMEVLMLGRSLEEHTELLRIEIPRKILEDLGIEEYWSRDFRTLSAGLRYRTHLASLLVPPTKLLLLDEPSTYLDESSLRNLFKVLEWVREELGISVVVADHRIDLVAKYVDHVIDLGSTTVCRPLERIAEVSYSRLIVEDLWFRYSRKDRWIVASMNLYAESGDIVAIVGPNGAGKSTLIKLMARVLKPSRGRIRTPSKMFYVPQNPVHWFVHDSLIDELKSFGLPLSLLEDCGLAGKALLHPHALSVGEARRFSIYIAASIPRNLVLIDEPIHGLDPESLYCIRDTLIEAAERGRIVVVATHSKEFAEMLRARIIELRVPRQCEDLWIRGSPQASYRT